MIAVASAIGFHAGPAAALAAVALAVAVGIAFSWLNLLLGLLVRNPESAGLAGLFPVIILVFTSSTLVPVATMPGWLKPSPTSTRSPPSSMRCARSASAAPPRRPCSKRSPGSARSSSPPSPPRSSATRTRPRNAATDVRGTESGTTEFQEGGRRSGRRRGAAGLTLAAQLHALGASVRIVDSQLDRVHEVASARGAAAVQRRF